MSSGTLMRMRPSTDELLDHLKASHAARTRSVRALRAVQAEYLEAERLRKSAARAALDTNIRFTHVQLADALGFRGREGLHMLARDTRGNSGAIRPNDQPYVFGADVLGELRKIADRFDKASRARRELVRELRTAPRDERLTFAEMGAAMGLSAEGARYLTRG